MDFSKYIFFLIFLTITVQSFAQIPGKKPSEEKRINELLAKMTLGEKIGQMAQFHLWSRDNDFEKLSEVIKRGGVGSFLNSGDRAYKEKLQRVAVEESRLGIPLIFGRDVIHGYRTMFPIPLGQAASWNPALIEKAAEISAKEAVQMGIDWTFAPMMDLARDPRWGRIAESFGEDPFLASKLAVSMTKGLQGDDLADPNRIAACAKHYVGYGAAEGGRDYNTTLIPEHDLRNFYLPPFKASVDAGVATIMSAFNDLNGVPTSGNQFTLRQILRTEWGFDGFVVSDWTSMTEMINHGYCADEREVALKSIKAGINMEMVSESYQNHLKELIESDEVNVKLLDDAVAEILRVKIRLGLFENPYPVAYDESVILNKDHLKVARDLATQSLVLLKNEKSVLPINKESKSIAVIGPLADSPWDQLGTWTVDGKKEDSITPLQTLKENVDFNILYAKGLENPRSVDNKLFEEAISTVKKADLAILFMGEDQIISGEAHSRAFIDLPGAQKDLINKISETSTPIVLVIMAGRPLTFSKIIDKVDAIVYAWHPGTMSGPAISDVLTGKVVPSGKLPVSFPRTVGQIPIYYNHRNTGRPPRKDMLGIPTGNTEDPIDYVSYYLDVDFTPQYPFGFGLSYSTFSYSDFKLSTKKLTSGNALKATVQLKNTGQYKADEIVQLYIRDKAASITRPVKELKGFQKVSLKAGESKSIFFEISEKDLAFWNIDMKFTAEPGMFDVMVGGSSADEDLLKESFELVN
ncbi:MAG: glycosyl hydrolase [Calditrichaeota bacterium]|nr:MAG: glycosyl hydrolase [Calditrichota bacterium]MBL1204836.1 glycosyl hydrolase [Calditrichota bacterium]NOG44665.1 glycosyl hydrolase [Calditrichota bacterium]